MGWKFWKTSKTGKSEGWLSPEALQAQGPLPRGVDAMPGAPAPGASALPDHADDDPVPGGGAPA
jgi:hypothetical protein